VDRTVAVLAWGLARRTSSDNPEKWLHRVPSDEEVLGKLAPYLKNVRDHLRRRRDWFAHESCRRCVRESTSKTAWQVRCT